MNTTDVQRNDTSDASATTVDLKFEALVIPVSDVDRAMEFDQHGADRRDLRHRRWAAVRPLILKRR